MAGPDTPKPPEKPVATPPPKKEAPSMAEDLFEIATRRTRRGLDYLKRKIAGEQEEQPSTQSLNLVEPKEPKEFFPPKEMTKERKRELFMELAKTKENPLDEKGLRRFLIEKWLPEFGGRIDPVTGNVILGARAEKLDLTEKLVNVPGTKVMVRMTMAEKLAKADAAMRDKYKNRWFRNKKWWPGEEWKWKAPKVVEGLKSNHEQYLIWLKALSPTKEDPLHRDFQALPPGFSYHETGLAIHVSNADQAEGFLADQGILGGSRGLYHDYWHFSVGEMKDRAWYEIAFNKTRRTIGGK